MDLTTKLCVATLLLLALGAAAPPAGAHITGGVDQNGDGDCDDPGEIFYEAPRTVNIAHLHACAPMP